MESFSQLAAGFEAILQVGPLLTILVGVATGIFVGAMPGLSPSMGVALVVPFTYNLSPTTAMVLLASIYLAANYGGSITAVTINTPGTPSAVVTALDGYPMTLNGEPGRGLGISLIASVVGGLFGTLTLIFFAKPLSRLALGFQPAEYFAVAVFGLTSVASTGSYPAARSLLMAAFGLLLNSVGGDPISGVIRFTFDVPALYDGFALIPALIGLFAISEVCMQLDQWNVSQATIITGKIRWPGWRDYWQLRLTILRSSLVGTVIGIFPGAGATVAAFVAYDVAKRLSRTPEAFGKGCPEGVAAGEAADSSSVGGALIPLLTLGIPGSASAAVLISALMIHDVVPGPRLMSEHPEIAYGLFASLMVANVMILLMGLAGGPVWVRVTRVPKSILIPLILVAAVIGSFSVRYSQFDVAAAIAFGVVGWLLRRHQFPVVPIVLGLVLGNLIEENLRQAILMDGYHFFLVRPLCLSILVVAFATIWRTTFWRRPAAKA